MTPDGQSNPSVCKMLMTNDYIHWFCRGALDYGEFALGFHGYTQEAADRWRTFTRYPEEIAEENRIIKMDTESGHCKGCTY